MYLESSYCSTGLIPYAPVGVLPVKIFPHLWHSLIVSPSAGILYNLPGPVTALRILSDKKSHPCFGYAYMVSSSVLNRAYFRLQRQNCAALIRLQSRLWEVVSSGKQENVFNKHEDRGLRVLLTIMLLTTSPSNLPESEIK